MGRREAAVIRMTVVYIWWGWRQNWPVSRAGCRFAPL